MDPKMKSRDQILDRYIAQVETLRRALLSDIHFPEFKKSARIEISILGWVLGFSYEDVNRHIELGIQSPT